MITPKLGRYMLRGVLGLALLLVAARTAQEPAAVNIPPVDVQAFSYSISRDSPSAAVGLHPADILAAGGVVLIPCANLGLLCDDPLSATVDDLSSLSYGNDFERPDLPPVHFSTAASAIGNPGTAVRVEATCSPGESQADVFQSSLNGSNAQDLDGNGIPCSTNGGFGLALTESAPSDNVDALEVDPCQVVDLDCNGLPDGPIYLTLAPASPTLTLIGGSPADILLATPDGLPEIWANAASLGLRSGDVIDALCMAENGSGALDPGDRVYISLAPGSPTLGLRGVAASDVLRAPLLRLGMAAATLGLATGDNLDALLCNTQSALSDSYLPIISRQ